MEKIKLSNNKSFSRIPDSVLTNLNSLDDLISKMGYNDDSSIKEFKSRLIVFKEFLFKNFKDLSFEEILLFDKYFSQLKELYTWKEHKNFLTAIEYKIKFKIQ